MITTLKGLKAKVKKYPERYGSRSFFYNDGRPCCPIAVEVTPYAANHLGLGYVEEAASRLGCTKKEVWDFIHWWDRYKLKLDKYYETSK